jgi:hypothetical protein
MPCWTPTDGLWFQFVTVEGDFSRTAFFGANTQSIVALAARYALPAIYDRREFTAVGGLMSYGTRFADVFEQGGIYTARILNGAKPADLPVLERRNSSWS